jgi:hypothetical protein
LTVGHSLSGSQIRFLCSRPVSRYLSSRAGLLDIFETVRWGHFSQNRRQ